ncbi:carboxypeptidase inhibitor SmCI-like [Ornithodoros turicata]|uniref:carboxypeptidase inhibitor SmCI-like n=1 Tax=Ornithodoros turicata TaxID=34597 RepID=UPI003139FA7D
MFHPLLFAAPFLLVFFARCDCNEITSIIMGGESSEEIPRTQAEHTIWLTCRTEHSSGTACPGAVNRTMFYHEPRTKKCAPFTFLGCGGNNNKFNTLPECERFCKGFSEIPTITMGGSSEEIPDDKVERAVWMTCHTEHSSGTPCPGTGNRTMFYHDPRTKKCTAFTFFGCGGNENKFYTRLQCERFCKVRPEGRCGEEMKQGICRAMLSRYYFDWKTWQCLRFYYGGCYSNGNNFETRKECERACKR